MKMSMPSYKWLVFWMERIAVMKWDDKAVKDHEKNKNLIEGNNNKKEMLLIPMAFVVILQ